MSESHSLCRCGYHAAGVASYPQDNATCATEQVKTSLAAVYVDRVMAVVDAPIVMEREDIMR